MGKIVLIEDEAGIRRSLTVSLKQGGYEVEPCEDGFTGLSKIDRYSDKNKDLDAVILDINLPDINGLKILQFLKEKYPELPVIMITGYGDEATEEEVKSRKGDYYLEKPIETEKLDQYLKNLLNRKEEILADRKTRDEVKLTTLASYAFININDEEKFLPVFQKLYFHENVMYCDATRGVFDMVLLLHGKSVEQLQQVVDDIRKIDGVDQVFMGMVEKPVLSEDLSKVISEMEKFLLENETARQLKGGMSSTLCSTYAFLEVEPEKFEKVFKGIYFLDNVVSCDTLKGPFEIVLLLKAPTFAEINQLITGRIARMDGVLRVSQCDIMNLLEM